MKLKEIFDFSEFTAKIAESLKIGDFVAPIMDRVNPYIKQGIYKIVAIHEPDPLCDDDHHEITIEDKNGDRLKVWADHFKYFFAETQTSA